MNITKRGDFEQEIVGPVAENFKVKKNMKQPYLLHWVELYRI